MPNHSVNWDQSTTLFSDETERFRSPADPKQGDLVTVRLRAPKGMEGRFLVLTGDLATAIPMHLARSDNWFDWYEAQLVCGTRTIEYCFLAETPKGILICEKNGVRRYMRGRRINPHFLFRFTPDFEVPKWARGAVQYQIFPDRFRNGDRSNDVKDREYCYVGQGVSRVADWYVRPEDGDYRHFYGGDLQGILDKLDYLQSLGVEVIYLNPIFVSPSSHKYDAQDYGHVDPHFGVILEDIDYSLSPDASSNEQALQYIRRVTSGKNLQLSDDLFAELCQEIHSRNMRIILDGVFNHCGSFHYWMDREGIYSHTGEFEPGAFRDPGSPYRSYFAFKNEKEYEGWWGHETLPKLNYEYSPALVEEILKIAEHWASPPYSIDGWRLDVAADVAHSREFNHTFWKRFRKRVRAVNPDLLILAEHYGDPGEWLKGDEWDSVMNYDAFMEPVTYFLTGMEKHSDGKRDDLYQNGEMFFEIMQENMARFEWRSLLTAMNELSNHDHSRFMTRTNRRVGRLQDAGSDAAAEGIDKRVFREAVVIQMTWPGAPTIYYADEAGQVGWTDPDNRRTYPWGKEDSGLIKFHQTLAAIRRAHPALREGSLLPLGAGTGWIAYGRFDEQDRVVTVCNNSDEAVEVTLALRALGAEEGEAYQYAMLTLTDGFSCDREEAGSVSGGKLSLEIPPRTAAILTRASEEKRQLNDQSRSRSALLQNKNQTAG
ncbi:MAG: glycoside hydrolase family 13 protein [Oscillospiraceae bacterium]|nr:glycoside hydrolase family 13 protein [Oscillospiraceae bacterium]